MEAGAVSSLFVGRGVSVYLAAAVVVLFMCLQISRFQNFVRRLNKVPGPKPNYPPPIGDAFAILKPRDELFRFLMQAMANWRTNSEEWRLLRFWIGPVPIVFIYTPEAAEVVLASSQLIDKSREYRFLTPWLNTGLLTSTGAKWHSRRKMLTPAFHFKILEDFIDIFNEQSDILIDKMVEAQAQAGPDQSFDCLPYVGRCTLDIICDTAMGRHVNAQTDGDSEYVESIATIGRIVLTRQLQPWYQPELIFQMSPLAKQQSEALHVLHSFTDKVIQERKEQRKAFLAQEQSAKSDVADDEDTFKKKPRLAFLDRLIDASQDGRMLSDLDIREEVDTFMFEGHDTTSASISWAIHLIGCTPHVQKRLREELDSVFGSDRQRPVTAEDLPRLKYLECCIKEALRLYPSVPVIGRTLSHDTNIYDYVIPAGTTVGLLTYFLHRDPAHFPDPEKYEPERFLAENARGRHPYCYVPFSAGPRNCIGQKYAMMEVKVVLANLFRRYHVESLDERTKMTLYAELVLRPRDGINIRMTPLP